MQKIRIVSVNLELRRDQPLLLLSDGRWSIPEDVPGVSVHSPAYAAGYVRGMLDRSKGRDFRELLRRMKG